MTTTAFIIAPVVLLALGRIAKAIKDTLSDHFHTSIFKKLNPAFWEKGGSWLNKYKNNDPNQGPKFFGSTTFLVWTTDGWHLFDTIQNTCYELAAFSTLIIATGFSWWSILVLIAAKLVIGTVFEIFYSFLLVTNNQSK